MRHHLMASTGLVSSAAISAALLSLGATAAQAETSISTARTTAVSTATISSSGGPDDVKITSAGSVKLPAGGGTVAVTINSNHKIVNEGTIQFTGVDGTTGISADAGVTSEITNSASGKIILDESYTPTDTDNDGDLDGEFATGTGRIGIKTAGLFTGNITNAGSIQIEGNNSFGVQLGGPLAGKFVNNGVISVLGRDSVGVQLGDVNATAATGSGNVRLAGTITATGERATAAKLNGNIAGTLEVQGALTATGYRYTTAPADPSKLDADDLLTGGSALVVGGNVAGGIILAVPPTDGTGDDRDNDGIKDSEEGSANVRSFGTAPAMIVGNDSSAITIGAVPSLTYGLINNGTVAGVGVYAGKSATAMQIGGLGGDVTIAGGIRNAGIIGAQSRDVAATAIVIGAGATVPTILNTGRIEAVTGGNTADAVATAIFIDEDAAGITTINNSNILSAKTGGDNGTAIAILDESGLVTTVNNSGAISATGALATSNRNVAIDLSAGANTSAQTINQTAVAAGIAAPTIVGDIKFGAGAGTLNIEDGSVKGNVSFGDLANIFKLSGDGVYEGTTTFGGGNDRLELAGTSVFMGTADFGGGADVLSIGGTSVFSGKLAGSSGVAATVAGGLLDLKGDAALASLAITDNGSLAVTIGGADQTHIEVTGAATFATGSKLVIQLASLDVAGDTQTVLTAGSALDITNLTTNSDFLPFLYKGTVAASGNDLNVTVARKSNSELGLNRSEASAFDAILAAASADDLVENTVLGLRSQESFHATLSQMLPEHEAGIFENATSGSRALARFLADPNAPYKDEGKWGWFVNQAVWGNNKKIGDTAGYKVSGWGISLGGEVITDLGNFGASVAFLNGKDDNKSNANEVTSNQFEGALHWRLASNGFQAHARVSGAPISLNGTRIFNGVGAGTTGTRTIKGKWDAQLYSASGAVSYDTRAAGFTLRPTVAVDYYKLSEDGYQESGGGDALDLTVNSRSSDELAVTGSLALGLEFGGRDEYDGWTRFELEAGRRQLVGGSIGSLTAAFKDGDPFTLTPEERTSGWIGRLRGVAGNSGFQFGGELSAEQQQGHTAWAFRASLRVGL